MKNFESFIFTMKIAQQEADLLKNESVLSELLLFSSQLDIVQGRYLEAKEKLNEVIKKKTELEDYLGLTKSLIEQGKLYKYLKNKESRDKSNSLALELAKTNNYSELHAEVLNNIANGEDNQDVRIQLYNQSHQICLNIGDRLGVARVLYNKGIIYRKKGCLDKAVEMYSEALLIFTQLGEKRRISFPLNGLGNIKRVQNKFDEAEHFYNKSLEIRRQLFDKVGTSEVLNNLGQLNFDNGNFEKAKDFFLEAIKLRQELQDTSVIISMTHRVFSLLDENERLNYYSIIESLIDESTGPNQISQFANIDLMHYCLSTEQIEKKIVQEKIKFVTIQNKNATLTDIDDLPVEAYYSATLKLLEIGENKTAKMVADDALNLIGERNSIRKETFQEIAKSVSH